VTRKGATLIICGECCEAEGICQLKRATLERVAIQGLAGASSEGVPGGTRCIMLTA
jgi:hypothetical protein